ncbi:hypothetical protein LguiA_001986 [Lonicera macranthoides]
MRFLSLKLREFRELQLSSLTIFQIRPSSDPKLQYKVPVAKGKKKEKYPKSVCAHSHIFNHSTHNPTLHYLDNDHIILLHTPLSRQSLPLSYTPSPHCLLSSLIFSLIFSHILIDIWPKKETHNTREFEREEESLEQESLF